MLKRGATYEEVCRHFQWQIPEYYNIGIDICDKWAQRGNRLALIYESEAGAVERYSFRDLKRLSDKLANALRAFGVRPGDRVGILLPQCPETVVSHIAVYKIGALAIPLFTLFGTDALEYRLSDSGAAAIVTDAANVEKILEIRDKLPQLRTVMVTGAEGREGVVDFQEAIEQASSVFEPHRTRADDPALIIYTSGTTGPPKGALHAHRVLLGHLPGVELQHGFFPMEGDLFWTPADWAWIGGLIDVLFPSLHHGIPVVARRGAKFDPEEAFALIARHGIRNAFIPPTALKMMRQVDRARERYGFRMRTIGSGGETLGEGLLEWGKETLGVVINEFYGQTEANLVISNCADLMEVRPGSMGRAVPGHVVEAVDDNGAPVPTGEVGEIAVGRQDPVMFLQYWNNPEATQAKYNGDWCLTGDLARKDEKGYFWFVGRTDDVITSSGYRMGPAEIEDCLMKHPAVTMAAVIGVPDEMRTQVVKAFIVLNSGVSPDSVLESEIQRFVKTRLAAHEYPRRLEFVEALPMTATGKIMRRELRQMEVSGGSLAG